MSTHKLRIIMEAFIESQVQYCPLYGCSIVGHFTTGLIKYTSLVYKDDQYTFQQLLDKDNTLTIHHRNLQKLAITMYKLQKNLSPKLVKEIFQEQIPT